jgi:hypothetical protein
VRARVDELIATAAEKAGVNIERVINELARIGSADIRQVVDWGPGSVTVKDSASIGDDAAAAVAEVGKTAHGIKVKLHDKVGALEKLGRHLGMFKDRVEVGGEGGGPIKVDLDRPLNSCSRAVRSTAEPPAPSGPAGGGSARCRRGDLEATWALSSGVPSVGAADCGSVRVSVRDLPAVSASTLRIASSRARHSLAMSASKSAGLERNCATALRARS